MKRVDSFLISIFASPGADRSPLPVSALPLMRTLPERAVMTSPATPMSTKSTSVAPCNCASWVDRNCASAYMPRAASELPLAFCAAAKSELALLSRVLAVPSQSAAWLTAWVAVVSASLAATTAADFAAVLAAAKAFAVAAAASARAWAVDELLARTVASAALALATARALLAALLAASAMVCR